MDNKPVVIPDDPIILPYNVISHDGDIYKFFAEYFKHDAGGFAFYIEKQKVAWFDYQIVKAIFISDNTEENTNDHRNYKKRGGYSDGDQGLE